MNEHKSVSESRIVITGLARDVSDVIDEEVSRLKQAFSDFEEIYFFIVESDSMDNTVEKLKELAIRDHCFDFLSLGAMQSKFPERIERLAHCRKIAAETIQKYEVEYVSVILTAQIGYYRKTQLPHVGLKVIGTYVLLINWAIITIFTHCDIKIGVLVTTVWT
jgi:hypothetical protein